MGNIPQLSEYEDDCYCVRLDEAGEVVQIHYSTRFRDTFCRQSLENVEPLYRALKMFAGLIYDPQNLVEMQLKTGAIVRTHCFFVDSRPI